MFRCNAAKNRPLLQTCCDLNINCLPMEGDTAPLHTSIPSLANVQYFHPITNGLHQSWRTHLLCFSLPGSIFSLIPACFGCCLARALRFIGLLPTQRQGDRSNNRRLDHPLEIWGRRYGCDCRDKCSVFRGIWANLLKRRRLKRKAIWFLNNRLTATNTKLLEDLKSFLETRGYPCMLQFIFKIMPHHK